MTTSPSQEESRLSDIHGTTSEMSFRDGEYDNKPVTGKSQDSVTDTVLRQR